MATDLRLSFRGVPPVDSPEFWRRAERTAVSPDPDVATAQVVGCMAKLARNSAADPVFREYAVSAVRRFRGGPLWAAAGINPFDDTVAGRRESVIAESAWWWARVFLRFVHHSKMIWERLRERDQWQLLISPDVLVRMWPMKGDCAVYATVIASMLECWRVPWEFVTVAVRSSDQPLVFSHVYVRAVLPDGRRFALDGSHGAYAGWQVPARDVTRLQVWNCQGQPVPDQGGEFRGLHYYAMARRGRGLLGLGDVCDPTSSDYDSYLCGSGLPGDTGTAPPTTPPSSLPPCPSITLPAGFVGPVNCDPTTGPPNYSPAVSTPTATSAVPFNWNATISNLLNQWSAIGGRVVAPQVTYTRGPNGQLIYTAPAGSASAALSSPLSLFGSTTSGSTLLLFGGGLLVLLLVAGKGK
jgi:hypothetical protein